MTYRRACSSSLGGPFLASCRCAFSRHFGTRRLVLFAPLQPLELLDELTFESVVLGHSDPRLLRHSRVLILLIGLRFVTPIRIVGPLRSAWTTKEVSGQG